MIEVKHVLYADTAVDAAAIMDNARASGAEEVRAEWVKEQNVYRVEYKTNDDNKADNA